MKIVHRISLPSALISSTLALSSSNPSSSLIAGSTIARIPPLSPNTKQLVWVAGGRVAVGIRTHSTPGAYSNLCGPEGGSLARESHADTRSEPESISDIKSLKMVTIGAGICISLPSQAEIRSLGSHHLNSSNSLLPGGKEGSAVESPSIT